MIGMSGKLFHQFWIFLVLYVTILVEYAKEEDSLLGHQTKPVQTQNCTHNVLLYISREEFICQN